MIDRERFSNPIWQTSSSPELNFNYFCIKVISKLNINSRNSGKNIVYHFPNKIYKNMLRVSLTKKMLMKRLTRVTIPNPDLHPNCFIWYLITTVPKWKQNEWYNNYGVTINCFPNYLYVQWYCLLLLSHIFSVFPHLLLSLGTLNIMIGP